MVLLYELRDYTDPETNDVYLQHEALKLVHDFIVAHPEGYIKLCAMNRGNSTSPDGGLFCPEPFYLQMFGSNDAFEAFISNPEFDHFEKINFARNMWTLYKNNGYKNIEIHNLGVVEDLMTADLQPLMDRFRTLKEIKVDIDKLFTAAFSDEELNYIERRLERNYLPITYYNNIHERVNELKKILI